MTKKDEKIEEVQKEKMSSNLESVLGTIALLMLRSPTHKHVFIGDWEWIIMPPVLSRQFKLFRDRDHQPIGFISWAKISPDVEQRLISGAVKLAPKDWNSGDKLYIIDIITVAPIQKQLLQQLYDHEFKAQDIYLLRSKKSGGLEGKLLKEVFTESAEKLN